ncbi:AAA family ATPase [Colletotrichum chrysophilum]|uniref:AAA family ATPase n=2 Tax=Colletotrichum chrysophilum TaxID=1836956 RepID=A0AAD9AGX6_9PEZI|nr:AAA family ATPase [Colletotrichum chrysophilum]
MSERFPVGPGGPDSDTDDTASEGENSSKLFMNETISRDVNMAKEEEGLLFSLNSKFDSSTLRLNSSHEPDQPEPQSQQQRPLGIPPGPGAVPPAMIIKRPGQPVTPARPIYGMPSGHMFPPGMVPPGGRLPPPPPPPRLSKIPNSRRPPVWTVPPGYKKKRQRGTYSSSKSSRSSEWRRKLQGSREPNLDHRLRDSSAEHLLPAKDAVSNVQGNGGDTREPSVVNHQTLVEAGSLAESLSTLAEQHLNIDILDQSKDVSNFISYLLDTIQILEAEVNYKEADSESNASGSDSDEENVPGAPALPCFQTFHRIYCTNLSHSHNRSVSEDEPIAKKKSASSLTTRLEVAKKIDDFESYLSKHPEVSFVIIKEHTCVKDSGLDVFQRRLEALEKPSQRSERLAILSPILRKALNQVAQYSLESSHDIVEDEIGMDAPYPFLFHHRERLVELADDHAYGPVLAPLLKFLDDNYNDEYEEAVRMFDQGVVNARHLPKLFQPHQLVILNTSDNFDVYALDEAPVISRELISFSGWSYCYAEVDLQQKSWSTMVSSVGSEDVNIADLKVHPVRFGRKEDLEKLTRRGQAFWGMKGRHYTCYTGWDHRHDHFYSSARFMVDLATHKLMHPSKKSSKNHPWPAKIKWEDKITAETMLLLPSTVYGFNLQEKKWVDLDVDKFHPITWNKDAFKRLVLEEKTKEMVYALVDIQTATKKMDDIITGKGNGLIVLLHGSPGTGKTLTAESVAEIAEKPLYRVTCGDIGTQAQDVEKYLATVLYLGKLWDCVLLLDEADVFLEERTFADLQRNSLVSVFLRILEYYEGILILTSNRVSHFDEAFKSRIQVAIHYDNLSKRSRKAIWQNFLDMIEESTDEDANIAELEEHLDQLASEEMSGRQIRNALLTARQLAKHRKERLQWVHLDQVMKTSAAFNKYLKTVRGQSDDKIAREEGRR